MNLKELKEINIDVEETSRNINNQIEMICEYCGNIQVTRDVNPVLNGVKYLHHPNEIALCCKNPYYKRFTEHE